MKTELKQIMVMEQEEIHRGPNGSQFVTFRFSVKQIKLLEKVAAESGRHSVSVIGEVFDAYALEWLEKNKSKQSCLKPCEVDQPVRSRSQKSALIALLFIAAFSLVSAFSLLVQ